MLLDVLWTAVFLAGPRRRRTLLVLLSASTVILFIVAWLFTDMPFAVAFLIGVQFGAIFGTTTGGRSPSPGARAGRAAPSARGGRRGRRRARPRRAVQREREAMARELHDVVAGHVMAMAIRAEAALSTTPDQTKDREALQAVRDAGLDAHGALRSMISVLRRGDGALVATPRWADLDGIVRDAERAGLVVGFDAPDVPEFGAAAEQAVVRIVREALTNCIRHAGGAEVDIEIVERNAEVQVRVGPAEVWPAPRPRTEAKAGACRCCGSAWERSADSSRRAPPRTDGRSRAGLPLEVRV